MASWLCFPSLENRKWQSFASLVWLGVVRKKMKLHSLYIVQYHDGDVRNLILGFGIRVAYIK